MGPCPCQTVKSVQLGLVQPVMQQSVMQPGMVQQGMMHPGVMTPAGIMHPGTQVATHQDNLHCAHLDFLVDPFLS